MVSENRVLRRISGCKRMEVGLTEGRGNLHNEKLHNLYSSPRTCYLPGPQPKSWTGEKNKYNLKQKNNSKKKQKNNSKKKQIHTRKQENSTY
jgi:hypothetical protein